MADKQIDPKFLKGLKFTGSEAKKIKVDGVEKTRYIPIERALTPADVLDWAEKGDSVVIVTADGQKYTVKKNGEEKEKEKEKEKGGK